MEWCGLVWVGVDWCGGVWCGVLVLTKIDFLFSEKCVTFLAIIKDLIDTRLKILTPALPVGMV